MEPKPAGRAPEVGRVDGWWEELWDWDWDWDGDEEGTEGRVIVWGKKGIADVPVGIRAVFLGSLSRIEELVGEEEGAGGGASFCNGGSERFWGTMK